MPQLDVTFFPTQIFWLVITFVPLYLIIWKIVVPRITDTLEARQKRIDDNLERANTYKDEAEAANRAYEKSIREAKAMADQIIIEAKLKLSEEVKAKENELAEKLDTLLLESDSRIQDTLNSALDTMNNVAEEITADTAQLFLNQPVDSTDLRSALNDAINQKN